MLVFHTGRKIPQIGYGTYQLNGDDCIKGCLSAILAGYRHIDTASIYRNANEIKLALKQVQIENNINRYYNDYN